MNPTWRAAALLIVCGPITAASAQTAAFGGSHAQDFDGLPAVGTQTLSNRGPNVFAALSALAIVGMEGWYLGNPGGSASSIEFRAQDGSLAGSAGRGIVSFGSAGSSDRALGALATSNQIGQFGLLLTNTSGASIDALAVSFTGEQWRHGDRTGLANTLSFAYGLAPSIASASLLGLAALDFVSPVVTGPTELALNGNVAAHQQALAGTLSGLNWGVGQTLALRWTINELSGQDDGLAIDHLRISAVPEPGRLALWLAGLAGVGAVVRRRAV